MDSLADILSGSESASTPDKAATTDVKTAEPVKEATAAPSAAKTTEAKLEVKTEKTDAKADDKPVETEAERVERTRNEKGQFAKTEDEIKALRTAMQAERRRAQEAERRLKEKEDAAKKADTPKTDFWENPEAAVEERLTAREQTLKTETESRFFNLCEDLAKEKHKDYDDVVSEFFTEAEADPSLGAQVFAQARNSRNPAEFLYQYAVNRREMKAVGGDLGKYKETLTAPLNTKIGALEAEIKALKTQLDNIGKVPSSLNAEPSATRATVEAEAVEPESLGEIFKPRKRRA